MNNEKDDMQEIFDLFKKTFNSTNRDEIDLAEKRLKELAIDFVKHLSDLFLALRDQTVKNDLKLSMILYIKNLIKTKIDGNTLTKDILLEIMRKSIEMILNVEFSDINLTNLGHCIEIILKSDPICNCIIINNLANILDDIQEYLYQYMNKIDNENKIKPIILLIEVIEKSNILNSENCIKFFTFILQSLSIILNFLLSKIQALNFENIVNELNVFITYVDLIENLFKCLYELVVKTKKLKVFSNFLETYQSKFLLSAIKLICLTIPTISPNNIIMWTREKEFDSKINLMKIRCLQFLTSVISSYKPAITNQELLISVNMLIEIFTNNLDYVLKEKNQYISNMEKDSKDFPDFNYSAIIYYIIQFFVIVLIKEPIINNFLAFSHKFFLNYIFPFLVFTNKEIDEMRSNGEQYNEFIMDLIDERKYRRIKTISFQLMDKMCVKYDGYGNFLVGYCLQLLEFTFKSEPKEKIVNYPLLNTYYSERIIINMTPEQKIESCLLIFSVLTHIITQSKKLISNLKLFLETYLTALLNIPSEIIRSRICFFLGFYVGEVFTEEKDLILVEKCIEYLVSNILVYNTKNEGLSFMASDTLNDLVNSKFYNILIEKIVLKNFLPLVETIDSIDVTILFDILLEIINNYTIDIHVLLTLAKLASRRILKEIKSPSMKNRKIEGHNVIINKCFSLLRNLCSKEQFVKDNLTDLENFLEPIYSYMKAPINFHFEDELFDIMKKIMINIKSVTELGKSLFPNLILSYRKNNHLNQEFFELICCYFNYGNDIVNSNDNFCQMLIDMFRLSVKDESYFDNPAMYSSILLQIWLQSTININPKFFGEILSTTITEIVDFLKLFNIRFQLDIYSDYLRFSNLLSIIYSSFIHYPILSIELVKKLGFYDHLIVCTDIHIKCSQYNSYNIKIIIIGLCGILTSESTLSESESMQLLNYLLSYLLRQKAEESKNLKLSLMKDLDCKFVDDQDEVFDDDDDDEVKDKRPRILSDCPYQEMTKNVSRVSPFDKLDEYEVFKKSIQKLKQSQNRIIDIWINKLNETERQILNNILTVRRIEVINNQEIYNIPRKILKIKKQTINNN